MDLPFRLSRPKGEAIEHRLSQKLASGLFFALAILLILFAVLSLPWFRRTLAHPLGILHLLIMLALLF
jgi:hypothetical protein